MSPEEIIKGLFAAEGKEVEKTEQFFSKRKSWPAGVYKTQDKYYLDTPEGTVEIEQGDWIVTTGPRQRYFVRFKKEPAR